MEENPFDVLVDVIRSEARGVQPAGLALGTVVGTGPLRILTGGNTLGTDRLLASADLLAGDSAEVNARLIGALEISANCLHGSHNAMSINGGTLAGRLQRTACAFQMGDLVLLAPIEEGQRYIIICRVVNL